MCRSENASSIAARVICIVRAEVGMAIAMVGKAERGPAGLEAIRKHKAAYLMAIGGAAYLVS